MSKTTEQNREVNVTNRENKIEQTARNQMEKLQANKSKTQGIKLHILHISKVALTIYQKY